jgi:hypothetical protein
MTDIARLGIMVDASPVDVASSKLTNFKKVSSDVASSSMRNTTGISKGIRSVSAAANSTSAPLNKMTTNAAKATKVGGGFANTARQMSLQLSQVAQQGSVTGDYLRAFTIQLPDLMLGFGTLGILIGAVAGALGGPLIEALTGTSGALDDMVKSVREGEKAFSDLGDAQAVVFMREQNKLIKETEESLSDQRDEVASLTAKLNEHNKTLEIFKEKAGASRFAASLFEGVIFETSAKIGILNEELQDSKGVLETLGDSLKNQKAVLEDVNQEETKRLESISSITMGLVDQLAALTLNNSGLLERKLIMEGATAAEIESALAIQKSIEAEKQKQDLMKQAAGLENVEGQLDPNVSVIKAAERRLEIINAANAQDLDNQAKYDALRLKNAQKLSDDLVSIEQRSIEQKNTLLTDSQTEALQQSGQLFGNLASLAKEGGKKQFDEYKALASAQAAISASLAIAGILGQSGTLGPFAIPLAVSVGALAAVQIAKINGQEYQSSRASGGQATGRVLVGENGPEVLSLGSQTGYISPNTSVGKGGSTVQQVFNISAGVQGTVQSEIMAAMPLFREVAIQAGAQSVRNGGTMAKAVGLR